MELTGHGVRMGLPRGWEGAIVRQDPIDLARGRVHSLGTTGPAVSAVVASLPVVHVANFPLPAQRGDFGSGAVEEMGADDVLVALVEYGPENVATALFAARGVPRNLAPADFDPRALQRNLPRQAGHQRFFTTADRAFCLYVVLGDLANARRLVGEANQALATLEIGPA